MKIALTSVFVDDQRAALAFYTEALGFMKRRDVPLGHNFWLTVGRLNPLMVRSYCWSRQITPP